MMRLLFLFFRPIRNGFLFQITYFLVLGIIASSHIAQANDTVSVTVNPIPTPTTQEFDHNNPPADLPAGEDADATLGASVTGAAWNGTWDPSSNELTITTVGPVTVSGQIIIRLPDNADQALKDHENGHADLFIDEYNRTAKKKAEDAMRGFKGKKFVGVGATDADRRADATAKVTAEQNKRLNNRARDSILDQDNTLNKKYDDLTKHGTSGTVNTEEGKKQAKAERDKATPAGSTPKKPASDKPIAGTEDPPSIQYDFTNDKLYFDISDPIDYASTGSLDPIIGAEVTLDPVQIIGIQEDGTIHLGTTEMTITKDGDRILHGYLWEMAYMTSNVDGFYGMIQAYLDVPPAFTDAGIVNSIQSDFLDEFQESLNDPIDVFGSTFWFYTDQVLFDNSGKALAENVTGRLKFGIGVPEPTSLGLLSIGIFAFLLTYARRRMKKITYISISSWRSSWPPTKYTPNKSHNIKCH